MRIKVLATDVDGTITDDKQRLSLKAVEAIRWLESVGIKVVLCSGNTILVLRALRTYIGCTGPVVGENGAVVDYQGVLVVSGDPRISISALKKLKEAYGSEIVESSSNPYRYVDRVIKRTLSAEAIWRVVRDVPNLKFFDSGFAYHFIDSSVNKGTGVEKAADILGVDLSEVAAVGDSSNDLDMLKVAGYSIALANAPQELKAVSDYVTRKPYGEGFCEAIEHLKEIGLV